MVEETQKTFSFSVPVFKPSAPVAQSQRVLALDGLRGWAALVVVCFHLLWETFGRVDPIIRNGFTAFALDGSLAVSIFFVLSGEALSSSYFSGRGLKSVYDLSIKRYPRLMIPILFTSVITSLIIYNKLNFNVLAGQIVDRADWLGNWGEISPGLAGTLRFALFDVFTKMDPAKSLIPFLWTMRIELIGSILVFALIFVCHMKRFGWHLLFSCFFLLMMMYILLKNTTCGNLGCFIFGMFCAKMRHSGKFDYYKDSELISSFSFGAIFALLATDGIMNSNNDVDYRGPIVAMALIFAISLNSSADKFLSNRFSVFLGRISFPLFLMQFPILISVTSAMIVYSSDDNHFVGSITVIFLASLFSCVVAALLFEPVEYLTKHFCKIFSKALRFSVNRAFVNVRGLGG